MLTFTLLSYCILHVCFLSVYAFTLLLLMSDQTTHVSYGMTRCLVVQLNGGATFLGTVFQLRT